MDLVYSLAAQFLTLPYPETDCTGKTIIVVGANIGLGKEAARHFVRLNASKVILAVRSLERGEAAKADIEATTKRTNAMEVWKIDLGSYESVKAFAAQVGELSRVDAIVANASIATHTFETLEDNESTITVNVVSTFLLVLLLIPALQAAATRYGIVPVLTIVSSDIHSWAKFPERLAPDVLAALNDEKTAVMTDRYAVSKLLQVFAFLEIASKLADKQSKIVLNMLNPGLCKTALTRKVKGLTKIQMAVFKGIFARSAEQGSRTLVHAALAGAESHGCYMSDCDVNKNTLSPFVKSPEGQTTQKKVWGELVDKLEKIQPGVTDVL